MQAHAAHLPRIFQANIARFYERVVKPGMVLLPVHSELVFGVAPTMDQFLDRAAAQVDNYTSNEAAKAYALTLSAVFERQLSVWARAIVTNGATASPNKKPTYEALLCQCAEYGDIDLPALGLDHDLIELLLVGNVVRHGEGGSCEKLRKLTPGLWDSDPSQYVDLLPGPLTLSEQMRIREPDLVRYIRAVTRFWGHADPLPMAVTDVPY